MSDIRVPDIGDFQDVPIIEIHVSPGDEVSVEDPLVTLESDKATMDVPAPEAGTVTQLSVKIGDRVSEGSVLLTLEAATDGAAPSAPAAEEPASEARVEREPVPPPPASSDGAGGDHDAQVVVIGSGPGGYTAAFRAADLGLKTVADRALRHARRGLPERRLHSLQGASARRARRVRGRGDGRARDQVRQAQGRCGRAPHLEGVGGRDG